ncbi:hypothetical protein ACJJTC_013957 [Scirpophaga incertulas]
MDQNMSSVISRMQDTLAKMFDRELKPIKEELSEIKDSMNFLITQFEDMKRSNELTTERYNKYIELIEANMSKNPRQFWTYIKAKRGGTSSYPTSMSDGRTTTSDGDLICELFSDYFAC